MPQVDYRARLSPKNLGTTQPSSPGSPTSANVQTNDVLGPKLNTNILFPLWSTQGVLFPYTPSLSTGNVAEYDPTAFIHTNYGYNAYVRSYPKPLSLSAEFTAQTNDEALYLLAVLWFFRSVTKSYFGVNPYNKAGTPPPVLVFNYLGDYQYNNVPVVVKDFSYTLEANIDYVPVNTTNNLLFSPDIGVSLPITNSSGYTYVPTHITVQLEMDVQYIPIDLRNNFNLDDFRQGKLLNKGYI
jgi:hypothetical protein